MNKQKQWICRRHKAVRDLAYLVLYPYMRRKYGVTVEKFKEQGDRPYLIVMNHQTAFDQFFVGCAFQGPVYYIASEDLFSMGWVSGLIRWLVNPIPIKKQTNDLKAVKTCLRVAREGGTICLAPEGNRTYSGKLCYIKPAIVKLLRALKLPLAIFRIEGGYGVQPRWCDEVRKGKMHAYVSRVVEPEEYAGLTDQQLLALITEEMNTNEASVKGEYHHKNLAQYLERAIYVCPRCGLSEFESSRDLITCKKCGRQVRYLPTKELAGGILRFRFGLWRIGMTIRMILCAAWILPILSGSRPIATPPPLRRCCSIGKRCRSGKRLAFAFMATASRWMRIWCFPSPKPMPLRCWAAIS